MERITKMVDAASSALGTMIMLATLVSFTCLAVIAAATMVAVMVRLVF